MKYPESATADTAALGEYERTPAGIPDDEDRDEDSSAVPLNFPQSQMNAGSAPDWQKTMENTDGAWSSALRVRSR